MLRDDEPTILHSIRAAADGYRQAENAKATADSAALRARKDRDTQRRLLADRVIVATREKVPQHLIAENADRTREWVRRTNLAWVDPETVTTMDGGFNKDPDVAVSNWLHRARKEGLEPKVLTDHQTPELARVLIYDTIYALHHEHSTVRAVRIAEQ